MRNIAKMQRRGERRKRAAGLVLAGLACSPILDAIVGRAFAEPAGLLASADPQRAEAMVKKCAKCHGDGGVSDDSEIPHLAAQSASYLLKQLQDFKADTREGGRMNKTAKKLDDQQMADLAALFNARELPAMPGVSAASAPALVSGGDKARGVDACADCHGADGRGKRDKYDAPALAGMPLSYFVTTMQAFRDGTRGNDRDGVMREGAKALSDAEIDTLASYYLALGGREPAPPP
ncbi:MAG: c-type cytochrome [Chromatiaceae bacterium]|nr:c-type cytochrome [Chromatiaceae bacterium]